MTRIFWPEAWPSGLAVTNQQQTGKEALARTRRRGLRPVAGKHGQMPQSSLPCWKWKNGRQ